MTKWHNCLEYTPQPLQTTLKKCSQVATSNFEEELGNIVFSTFSFVLLSCSEMNKNIYGVRDSAMGHEQLPIPLFVD